jgi:polyisoprenoid-binding protein YceI
MREIALTLVLSFAALAQPPSRIDTSASKITVYAYKSGLFSFAAHDHQIAVPISEGTLDEKARTIQFTVKTAEMKVLDPDESEKNRAEIRATMLGPKLLEAERFPTIAFKSTAVRQVDDSTAEVEGVLTLHGVSRNVRLTVSKRGSAYSGSAKMKQSDYGLTPVSVAGGTVKVKDEVKVEFSVVAE